MTSTGFYAGEPRSSHVDTDRAAQNVPLRMGQMIGWAGALVSLGLVVGTGVWAVQLATRDVSNVPVIRALDGPMRAAPVDPGGTQAAHQGLAVNRLAEGAEAGAVPDQLILAPPPVDLVAMDLSSSSRASELDAAQAGLAQAAQDTAEPTPPPTHELIQRLILRNQSADQELSGAATIAAPELLAVPAPNSAAVIPASVAGVAQSIRPMWRPGTLAAPASASAASVITRDIDPATLTEGTRLVQLGAFDSPAIAMAEWDRLTARFPDYFNGRGRVIQQASSGGADFFRLRAHGFEDLGATRRFCAVLIAQNAPCIPVTVR